MLPTFGVADPPEAIRILMTPQLILEDRRGTHCNLIASCYTPDRQAWHYEIRDSSDHTTNVTSVIGYRILGEATPIPPEAPAQPRPHEGMITEAGDVILEGGPTDLPDHQRRRNLSQPTHTLKLPFRNGYEHFAATRTQRKLNGQQVAVFRWSGSTKIAE